MLQHKFSQNAEVNFNFNPEFRGRIDSILQWKDTEHMKQTTTVTNSRLCLLDSSLMASILPAGFPSGSWIFCYLLASPLPASFSSDSWLLHYLLDSALPAGFSSACWLLLCLLASPLPTGVSSDLSYYLHLLWILIRILTNI